MERIIYGYLYTWAATQTAEGATSITNTGVTEGIDYHPWRVPSNDDYIMMSDYLMGFNPAIDPFNIGTHLKSRRNPLAPDPNFRTTTHPYWDVLDPLFCGLDTYNTNLVAGGYRAPSNGASLAMTEYGSYWTSTEFDLDSTSATCIDLMSNFSGLSPGNFIKGYGHSIRLVRLATPTEIATHVTGDYLADYVGNDGKTYKTVLIGGFVWLAENLAETKLRNDSDIDKVETDVLWAALDGDTDIAYCAYDDDDLAVRTTLEPPVKPKLNKIIKKQGKESIFLQKDYSKKNPLFEKTVTDEDLKSYIDSLTANLQGIINKVATPLQMGLVVTVPVFAGAPGIIELVMTDTVYEPTVYKLLRDGFQMDIEADSGADPAEVTFTDITQRGEYTILVEDGIGRSLHIVEDENGNPIFVAGDNLLVRSSMAGITIDHFATPPTIVDIPDGTTVAQFIATLNSTDGSTQVYEVTATGEGAVRADDHVIITGDELSVFAENLADSWFYVLTVV